MSECIDGSAAAAEFAHLTSRIGIKYLRTTQTALIHEEEEKPPRHYLCVLHLTERVFSSMSDAGHSYISPTTSWAHAKERTSSAGVLGILDLETRRWLDAGTDVHHQLSFAQVSLHLPVCTYRVGSQVHADACPPSSSSSSFVRGNAAQCLPGIHFFRLHAFEAFDVFVSRYLYLDFCWASCAPSLARFLDAWCRRESVKRLRTATSTSGPLAAFQGWDAHCWKKIV
jgi:hypothetical protein